MAIDPAMTRIVAPHEAAQLRHPAALPCCRRPPRGLRPCHVPRAREREPPAAFVRCSAELRPDLCGRARQSVVRTSLQSLPTSVLRTKCLSPRCARKICERAGRAGSQTGFIRFVSECIDPSLRFAGSICHRCRQKMNGMKCVAAIERWKLRASLLEMIIFSVTEFLLCNPSFIYT